MCHVKLDPIPDMLKSKKAIDINAFDSFAKELRNRVERRHAAQ